MSFLSTIVLATHLLAVDLAMAAPLACLALDVRSRRNDPAWRSLARKMGVLGVAALVAGAVLGGLQLVVLWIVQDEAFWQAARAVTHRRLAYASAELVFYVFCMAAWHWTSGLTRRPRLLPSLLLVAAASNLMYHFPPLFGVLNVLATRGDLAGQTLDVGLYRTLMVEPQVVSMTLHVWLAAIAVTAVAVMWLAARQNSPAADAGSLSTEDSPPASLAARWALGATLLQLPLGVWVLLTLPNRSRTGLMGGDALGTACFALGLVAALGLMHHLAAVALGDRDRRQISRSVWLIKAVVLLMSGALERSHVLERQDHRALHRHLPPPRAVAWETPSVRLTKP